MKLIDTDILKSHAKDVTLQNGAKHRCIDSTIICELPKVEIVRCKDCKRRGTYDCPVYVGGDGMYSEPDDWFCADGEPNDETH